MDDLLPFYERELAFMRRGAREFGERYPKIAARLQMSAEACDDPQVEQMLEAFSLLTARISKKIQDDFPEITESLLEVLYPHYLRPFPSCSIAHFDAGASMAQLSAPTVIPRGTELTTRTVKGVPCKFRTAFEVEIEAIRVSGFAFAGAVLAPGAVRLPAGATGCISVSFEAASSQWTLGSGARAKRLYLDGDPSCVAALREALLQGVVAIYAEPQGSGVWHRVDADVIKPVGLEEDESLIDWPARSHPAYRLLTEYFAFPEKFNFVDLDLARAVLATGAPQSRMSVHFVLTGIRADSNQARLIEGMGTNALRLACSPVVNAFRQRGEPIRVTHQTSAHSVLCDSRRAYAYEVYSIDSVNLVRQTPQGDTVTEFRPFYSLRHGENPAEAGHYWIARRDEDIAQRSPGYETELSIVDLDFDPASPQTDTLSLELTCTNRDLPSTLAFGMAGGDLFLEGGSVAKAITLLRKPTRTVRFERGRGAHWRLISHLSLNHLSLERGGLAALRETLRLYDQTHSSTNTRIIDGICDIEHRKATVWLPGNPFATIVRGIEVRVTVDEDAFVGSGLDLFARVMDRFFGLYVHANSFSQLVVLSKRNGEELVRCAPRSGDISLL